MPLDVFRNAFAGNPLDRAGERRTDPAWLAARLNDPQARVLPLVEGRPRVEGAPDGPRLAYASGAEGRALAADSERLAFLGLDADGPVFAVDLDEADAESSAGSGRFEGLRALAPALPAAEAAVAAAAKALFEWRRRHRFCSVCGTRSQVAEGGWKRVCPNCGAQHFPRTDPVVIMLPVRGELCLLGRQAVWPPGMFSALAGFVEPGESLEEACAREVREEAGLEVASARYHSSQPWPFPHSLMVGLIAQVPTGDPRPDLTELEAVRWTTRGEARRLTAGETVDGVTTPPPLAIAHQLLRAWAAEG